MESLNYGAEVDDLKSRLEARIEEPTGGLRD